VRLAESSRVPSDLLRKVSDHVVGGLPVGDERSPQIDASRADHIPRVAHTIA
jgi:hypothetical protein